MGYGKVPVDLASRRIALPHTFRNLVTPNKLLEDVFFNIQTNYVHHVLLSEVAILAT